MYRVGLPGWKLIARLGQPLEFRVRVHKDEASGTYWAESDDLNGLAVSGKDHEELEREIKSAAYELLELAMHGAHARQVEARMEYRSALCAA